MNFIKRFSSKINKNDWTIIVAILSLFLAFCTPQAFAESLVGKGGEQRIAAENFPGDDIGAQINAAVVALNQESGIITVTTPGEISTPVQLGVGQILEFGPGIWQCSAAPAITLDNASQVIGAGVFLTKLILDPSSMGPLLQSKDFSRLASKSEAELATENHSLAGDYKSLPGVKYIRIRGLTLYGDKNNHSTPANGIEIFGLWYWLEDLSIENFSGDGLVTQFITAAEVTGNDAMESYFTNIKLLNNVGNGWTLKGPHDSIISGVISARNGGWGIDVMHENGYYSGGGAMFTNTHLYGNKMGLRTAPGANILAFGLESEANKGVGLLLRSNDSVIQGIFYANGTYGIQIGEQSMYAGANVLNVQVHNNHLAQINWESSGGYNTLYGSIYPMEGQKYFELPPTRFDQVLTAGPQNPSTTASQYFPGGIQFDNEGNINGIKNLSSSYQNQISFLETRLALLEKKSAIAIGILFIIAVACIAYVIINRIKGQKTLQR